MQVLSSGWMPFACAALLGVLNTFSFAPTPGGGWLELLVIVALFIVLQASRSTRGAALRLGAFGFGNYVSGVWWLYVSMHDYGGMAAPLAGAAVVLFTLYLAIYPALAGAIWYRVVGGIGWRSSFAFAAAWTLGEWLRGLVFTGFPWLASGYPQVDGPLAGFAPMVGVYGVGFTVALVGALLVQTVLGWRMLPDPAPRESRSMAARRARKAAASPYSMTIATPASPAHSAPVAAVADRRKAPRPSRSRLAPMILALLVLVAGIVGESVSWTHPSGQPVRVRLLQGNVKQDMKFSQTGVDASIALYQELITGSPADLIVTPETAIPLLIQDVPDAFAQTIRQYADRTQSAILFGAVGDVMTNQGPRQFTNSLYGLTPGQRHVYQYDKHHLVPFGEFVPQGFHWFVRLMNIPLGDFDRGAPAQPPFEVKGTAVAPDICYEDIFGEEIAHTLRHQTPRAGVLVNTSNLGWFGNTIALPQHLQMARMRAIETGRPMLRSTNTGITAMIEANGTVAGSLQPFTVGSLTGTVQGMDGVTPYILFGNWPIVTASLVLLLALVWRNRRAARWPAPESASVSEQTH
ncbi:apolipoprotein N-acyltransferase [Pararobbsia alpina]|uniref:Apolipoprotein N-acyltransferase n=1 Tax=Pararobbsia alpina TaxID=621374 RepID=A0A6S7AYT9_9BURK|nr:apolipoprotein N-acyltransferase [Pararobbsia alpina]CAB3779816.1 Apolipoprotein N-acyltransferase [Pararobbsia alpina]